eukprot:SAG31_NODE_489_length_14938_cov_5.644113_3_plen_557_part_00
MLPAVPLLLAPSLMVLNGTDVKGGTVHGFALPSATTYSQGVSACSAACLAKASTCAAWVFVQTSKLGGPRCVLKAADAGCRQIPRTGCVSAVMNCSKPAPPAPPLDPYRTGFHAHVPSGATADTNGPMYFGGWYHLFAQYRPGTSGHPHYWYHWASKDLLGWSQLGAALSPSSLDCGAVWSGSATVSIDPTTGRPMPALTAAMPCQTGITVATPVNASHPALAGKWTQRLLLRADPKQVGTVADPTTGWKGSDGDWRMLVACNRSAICQYKNDGGFLGGNWTYAGQFAPTFASECPDFYRIPGTSTYVISGGKLGMYWRVGNYTEVLGLRSVDQLRLLPAQLPYPNRSKLFAYDIGPGFGAPKSFYDPNAHGGGRQVLFGAIGGAQCRGKPWDGLQSLPRVVELDSPNPVPGQEQHVGIRTYPIPELAKLRTRSVALSSFRVPVGGVVTSLPPNCHGSMLDIELKVPIQARLNLTLLVLASATTGGTSILELGWTRPMTSGGVPVTLTTSSVGDGQRITPSLDGVPFLLGAKESSLALRVVVDVVTGRSNPLLFAI